ncbi:hypothetical protein V1512DRAFT_256522 [Lipomyces arxii]|uniref:uncharacterized protein n=1 Tax=Lipomyces arxii TaxID=56418 RepID=UPI0034CD1D0F
MSSQPAYTTNASMKRITKQVNKSNSEEKKPAQINLKSLWTSRSGKAQSVVKDQKECNQDLKKNDQVLENNDQDLLTTNGYSHVKSNFVKTNFVKNDFVKIDPVKNDPVKNDSVKNVLTNFAFRNSFFGGRKATPSNAPVKRKPATSTQSAMVTEEQRQTTEQPENPRPTTNEPTEADTSKYPNAGRWIEFYQSHMRKYDEMSDGYDKSTRDLATSSDKLQFAKDKIQFLTQELGNALAKLEEDQMKIAVKAIEGSRTLVDDPTYQKQFGNLSQISTSFALSPATTWVNDRFPTHLKFLDVPLKYKAQALIAQWLVSNIFDKYLHPALPVEFSKWLKKLDRDSVGRTGEEIASMRVETLKLALNPAFLHNSGSSEMLKSVDGYREHRDEIAERFAVDFNDYIGKSNGSLHSDDARILLLVDSALAILSTINLERRCLQVQYYQPAVLYKPDMMNVVDNDDEVEDFMPDMQIKLSLNVALVSIGADLYETGIFLPRVIVDRIHRANKGYSEQEDSVFFD